MGSQLSYEASGTGPPLVLLHGITADHHHWDPVVARLEGSHRCFNVDLLGHGASPGGGAVDLLAEVGAVLELLEDLVLEAPVLVGHSYGAFVATFTATARPVGGVVNVDQTFDTVAFRQALAPLEERLRGDDFDAAFADFVATQRPDLVPAERRDLTMSHLRPRKDVVLGVWGAVLDAPPEELTAQVEAALPAVAAPYLGIFGSPISGAERRLQGLIPDSRIEVWDGMGHFVHLVDPDRTADRVADFAATCR